MSDLIDRQTAIDAAIEATDSWDGFCSIGQQKLIENYFNSLPFAPGMDLISRRAAIDICANVIDLFRGQFGAGVLVAIKESIEELPPAQLGTNLAEVGTDSISRQQVIGVLRNYLVGKNVPCDGTLTCRLIENEVISKLPPAQSEIIYCKDCVKHNKGLGNYEVHPDGSTTWIWKDSACPLVSWRDKAQGHEFDYQFCAYAEKRDVTK